MKKNFKIFLLVIILGSACNNKVEKKGKELDNQNTIKSTANFEIIVYTKYEIPLNIDLINFLYQNGIEFNQEILNPLSNREGYFTEISKALNLGIYTSDLAYCTVFYKSQLSLEYFDANRLLAQELGFSEGYDKVYYQRLERNASNKDSLKRIAEESYWKACNFLEDNNKNNILPFVVFGGWIETMYLFVEQNQKNPEKEILKKQIIIQNDVVSNIIKYLYEVMIETSAYYYNEELKIIIAELKVLDKLYKDFNSNQNEIVFQKIESKIKHLRDLYINKV